MKDAEIVTLLWDRNERALDAVQEQYRSYLTVVALQHTGDELDCQEILNDTYLALWNSIPPHKPQNLRAFAAKIVRRLAIKRYEMRTAQKRVASEYAISLEELRETLGDTVAAPEDEARELGEVISSFLHGRTERERNAFIHRYFYADPIAAIAKNAGVSESAVYKMLTVLRRDLKAYLKEEGYFV